MMCTADEGLEVEAQSIAGNPIYPTGMMQMNGDEDTPKNQASNVPKHNIKGRD
jgi:hypothetical protein